MIHLVLGYRIPAPRPHRPGPCKRDGAGLLQRDTRVLLLEKRPFPFTPDAFILIRPSCIVRDLTPPGAGYAVSMRLTCCGAGCRHAAPCFRVAAAYCRGAPGPHKKDNTPYCGKAQPPPLRSRHSSNSVFSALPGETGTRPIQCNFPARSDEHLLPQRVRLSERPVKAGFRKKEGLAGTGGILLSPL